LSAPYLAAVQGGALGGTAGGTAAGSGANDPRQADHRHSETSGRGVRGIGPAAAGPASSSHGSLLLLLAFVLGGAVALVAAAKLAVRRLRYLTRNPRRIAAACRQELADFLLDQRIDAARSATLHELGALVRMELTVEPDGFVAAASAARFGPPGGAGLAARNARRELRLLVRAMRRRMRARDRARGLVSLRSFGFVS
jgi:hypothetical protein